MVIELKSGKTSVFDTFCVCLFVGVGGGCGVNGCWIPLPTRLQQYCDPASLVFLHLVLRSCLSILNQGLTIPYKNAINFFVLEKKYLLVVRVTNTFLIYQRRREIALDHRLSFLTYSTHLITPVNVKVTRLWIRACGIMYLAVSTRALSQPMTRRVHSCMTPWWAWPIRVASASVLYRFLLHVHVHAPQRHNIHYSHATSFVIDPSINLTASASPI